MTRTIYLVNDERLQPMMETPYDTESLLQRFLAQYPALLGGDQMDLESPRRLMLVKREMDVADREDGARRWSLDHLFLDQDGIPTLVEVKRASNTQVRREVVAQMLDYAANGVLYWPLERIRASFEETCHIANRTAAVVLAELFQRDIPEDEEADESTVEAFWNQVKTNLEAERLRLVFVADEIPASLQRVVEFLNGQMNPTQVLAVEIKQFINGEQRIMVPRVIGQTAKAQTAKGGGRTRTSPWDPESFLDFVKEKGGADAAMVVTAMLAWAQGQGLTVRWLVSEVSGFVVELPHGDQEHALFRVKPEDVVVLFKRHGGIKPFDAVQKRIELASRLNAIPGVSVDGTKAKPSIPLQALSSSTALNIFLKSFEWFVAEVRSTA